MKTRNYRGILQYGGHVATKYVRCSLILFSHVLAVLRIHDYNLRLPEIMRTVDTPRRGSANARLLGQWVRIPSKAWMSVCCECVCCQVEVSASDWSLVRRSPTQCVCVCVRACDREASIMTRPWPTGDCRATEIKITLLFTFFQILYKLAWWWWTVGRNIWL